MDFDIIICGAGVVGLAIAQELSSEYSCLVIDKEDNFGQATSSRNSEVIHAGLYYPPNSLKSKLCIEGNRLLYDWCNYYKIPHKKIGKYLTAISNDQIFRLEEIYNNAIQSGATGISWVTKQDFMEIEPNIVCNKAVYSQNTGIIDSHAFMYSLESVALSKKCTFLYSHKMVNFQKSDDYLIVELQDKDGSFYSVSTKHFINCAGLYSDIIAEMTGLDIRSKDLILEYWKGHYYKLVPSKANLASHLIYPVVPKNSSGLGIHLTKDLNGYIKFGPDSVYDNSKTESYILFDDFKQKFFSTISTYLYDIKENDIDFDQIGIRPKLNTKYLPYRDFYICNTLNNLSNSIINLIGIESPGLTSSLAIAKYVYSLLNSQSISSIYNL